MWVRQHKIQCTFPNTKSFQILCASSHSQLQQGKGGGGAWAGKTLSQQDAPLLQQTLVEVRGSREKKVRCKEKILAMDKIICLCDFL